MSNFTSAQEEAIVARGNVLVVAGAGTGKTRTLVERCLRLVLDEGCSLEKLLLVTFTEAAAAEMRQRIRAELVKRWESNPDDPRLNEQIALLDTARIGTLHGFCLQLVRQHFHELEIDPQVVVLDEAQTRPLIEQTLEGLIESALGGTGGEAEAVRQLIRAHGRGSDGKVRELIVKLHRYTQTLGDPEKWWAEQEAMFQQAEPAQWRAWFGEGCEDWRARWLPVLRAQRPESTVTARVARVLEAAGDGARAGAASGAPVSGPASLGEGVGRAGSEIGAPGWADVFAEISAADGAWPKGKKTEFRKPLEKLFDEAEFLQSLLPGADGRDPLAEDWVWVRGHLRALLRLGREFTAGFSRAKRELGGVDFADLEQFALRLLREPGTGAPTRAALQWQAQFEHVFVDEYQDINGAQDAILSALSRVGTRANRFLVGDIKQSIYRFRLANPRIFLGYEALWRADAAAGRRIPLADNFRSRAGVLDFINPLFAALMRPAVGGVVYDEDARLRFGKRAGAGDGGTEGRRDGERERRGEGETAGTGGETPPELAGGDACGTGAGSGRAAEDQGGGEAADSAEKKLESPHVVSYKAARVELHLVVKPERGGGGGDGDEDGGWGDLESTEREARVIAARLRELRDEGHEIWDDEAKSMRAVRWGDMAVLLRSPASRAEAFAKEFHRAGVPLAVARGGFYASLEVSDLLGLLRLLDNPLQDLPLLAVLRSPLVGLSAAELARVRVGRTRGCFWDALRQFQREGAAVPAAADGWAKVDGFLKRFDVWRERMRQTSLSYCLETALAETHYEALLQAEARGAERVANVRRLLDLARQYDPYQRQGLYRFLRFIEAQAEAELDLAAAAGTTADAVQLLSIHRSKGLEFPVVVVGCLGAAFNFRALEEDILLDEHFGLCPRVVPPDAEQSYPSLPWWLARQRERRELLGEELRLLYVALTRARDTLVLVGSDAKGEPWATEAARALTDAEVVAARNFLHWLRAWLPQVTDAADWADDSQGGNGLVRWWIHHTDGGAEADAGAGAEVEVPSPVLAEAAALDAEDWERLGRRVTEEYPWVAATLEPAKTSVSVLRRRQVEADEEAKPSKFSQPASGSFVLKRGADGELTATERGTAHHSFMELVEVTRTGSLTELRAEGARLVEQGLLRAAEAAALNWSGIAGFWASELGDAVRRNAGRVQRELPFTARVDGADLLALGLHPPGPPLPAGEFVVIQGVVDLALILPDEIRLVDFKTDRVEGEELRAKARAYEPQLGLYARALERIYHRPVRRKWLYFLESGRAVEVY